MHMQIQWLQIFVLQKNKHEIRLFVMYIFGGIKECFILFTNEFYYYYDYNH